MRPNQFHKSPPFEDLETAILRKLSIELSSMFPKVRISALPPLRGARDGARDQYGLSSEKEALRLYIALAADFWLFSCEGGGWLVPEPLYGLSKEDRGVHLHDLLFVGSFHIGVAWVDQGRSFFEPELRQFLKRNGAAPCKR